MRIVSKFVDYYDSVQRMGADASVLYIRNHEILEAVKFDIDFYHSNTQNHSISSFVLGYCGQIVKGMKVKFNQSGEVHYFYDIELFKDFTLTHGILDDKAFTSKSRWWRPSMVKFIEQDLSKLDSIFHDKHVPLFVISGDVKSKALILNPSLKALNYQSQKDPYTAFQDISQFVGGVLNGKENQMVQIKNSDKIAKHGFDKWSFRKLPSKKS